MQDDFGKWLVRLVLGAALVIVIRFALLTQVTHSLAELNTTTQQSFAAMAAKSQADAARRAAEQETEKRLRLDAQAANQRAIATLAAENTAAEHSKDLAWQYFYTAPKTCEHPVNWGAQVECGNQFMRAKKQFKASYDSHLASR